MKKNSSGFLGILIGLMLSFFFLMVFLKRMLSQNSFKDASKSKSKQKVAKKVYDAVNKLGLSARQKKIMNLFDTQSKVYIEDLQKILPKVHVRTIRRDLSDLSDKKLVKKQGKTKGSFYIKS